MRKLNVIFFGLTPFNVYWVIVLLVGLSFSGCLEPDEPIKLPPPGNQQRGIIDYGSNYETLTFFQLSTGKAHLANLLDYDLAIESSPTSELLRLNTGKAMFVYKQPLKRWSDRPAVEPFDWTAWDTDPSDGNYTVMAGANPNKIYLIDRGRLYHNQPGARRFIKLAIETVNPQSITIAYCDYDADTPARFTIQRQADYAFSYFSFEKNGQQLQIAPKKNEWDLFFGQYIYLFQNEPPPVRFYLVRGVQINRANNVRATSVDSGMYNRFPSYEEVSFPLDPRFRLTDSTDVIGHNWKDFNIQGQYFIRPRNYYLIQDRTGAYYKLRFTTFYNPTTGARGYTEFVYQRL